MTPRTVEVTIIVVGKNDGVATAFADSVVEAVLAMFENGGYDGVDLDHRISEVRDATEEERNMYEAVNDEDDEDGDE